MRVVRSERISAKRVVECTIIANVDEQTASTWMAGLMGHRVSEETVNYYIAPDVADTAATVTGRVPLQTGDPSEPGVYACRVPMVTDEGEVLPLLHDKILMWHERAWWYPRSTERYRGDVEAFAGPLQRMIRK